MKQILMISMLGSVIFFACGEDDNGGGGSDSADRPAGSTSSCTTAGDCPSGSACIQVGSGPAGCVPTCSGEVNECGGSAQCSGVGVLEVDICQPEPDPMDPPKPDEQPKIPCREDVDCSSLHPEAICAEWRGARDCTIPCMSERACDPPSIGGISIDFMDCQDDERSDKMRTACLPRAECFDNPLNCISGLPGGGDFPGGDFPGGGDFPDAP